MKWPFWREGQSQSVKQAPALKNEETYTLDDVEKLSELFNIQTGIAGYSVNPKTAIKVSIVYACCRLISGAIAQMPVKVFRETSEGSREPVGGSIKGLLNLQPTPRFSAALFWEFVTTKVLLSGDAFVVILRNANGTPVEFLPVESSDVHVQAKEGRNIYSVKMQSKIFVFDQDDILHFSNFGFDGLRSPSVIRAGAANSIGIELAMEDYSADFFQNGSHQSVAITKEGRWDDEQKQSVREQWVEKYSGLANKKFPLVFDKSVGIHTLSINAKDSQLLESREFQITEIARAFGLPSFMVNQEQKTTSWGSGVSEIGQIFLRYTLMPYVQRFEQELNRKLFLRSDKFANFVTAGLVRATIKERYESYKSALGGSNVPGFLSINEVRRLEDMPRIDNPDYDKPYIPPEGGVISAEQS